MYIVGWVFPGRMLGLYSDTREEVRLVTAGTDGRELGKVETMGAA